MGTTGPTAMPSPIASKCIYIDAENKLSIRTFTDSYRPQDDQVLIKVHYSGVNPADLAHGLVLGINDNICGYDFCGTVMERGPTSSYAVGEVIFGFNSPGKGRPRHFAAHQDFLITRPNITACVPSALPQHHAAVLPTMVRTAADALLNIFSLEFALANVKGKKPQGALLIWGGASSVGTATIQLAKAIGFGIILTTASPKNHNRLRELGATHCFDYQEEGVVQAIQEVLDQLELPLTYIFDTVCKTGSPSSNNLCESLKTDPHTMFAAVLPNLENLKWQMVIADRGIDFPLPPPIGILKADTISEVRLQSVVQWVAANYGYGFKVPNVRVVEGAEEGIKAINASALGSSSFEKTAIEHPM